MKRILIKNGQTINEGKISTQDILIDDGRIEKIASSISNVDVDKIIDVAGKYVLPGMIDDQVHFREPGTEYKGEIKTESAAAVAGGVTSYMEMPNTKISTTTDENLADKKSRASKKSMANYAFYMGATNDNLEVIKAINPLEPCGIKVFMGSSTGNMLVDDPEILEGIFSNAPIIVVTHCEDTPTILKNEEIFKEKYGIDLAAKYHPLIRSEEACYLSSTLAVQLAKKHDTNLHVLHLTTAKELEFFTAGELKGKKISAEVCLHHLFFSEKDYEEKGHLIKCNPAIKREEDRLALLKAFKDDKLDILATDHAPHTWEEKQNNYFSAPAGIPLVQHVLIGAYDLVAQGHFSLEMLVQKTSHNVAERFQVKERGYLREGYWADITVLDVNKPTVVNDHELYAKCNWSPFEGHTFKASIDTTIVSGQLAYENGKLNTSVRGQALEFNR
ncbi:MAG: dihydroorotase [Planctomycetota bacterium]|nr:MAG: dihydroorotase [Planctomycetota bacterium]